MAKSDLTAAQRRVADRIDGAALYINDTIQHLDAAARNPFLRNGHVSRQIKHAMVCAFDALSLVRACVPANRRAEIEVAMRCLDRARA